MGPLKARVRVHALAGDGPGEPAVSTRSLLAELDRFDVAVDAVPDPDPPGAAKSGVGVVVGLVVGVVTSDQLRDVVHWLAGWARRTGRSVEIGIDGDPLKVTDVSAAEQRRIVDEWLARHPVPRP